MLRIHDKSHRMKYMQRQRGQIALIVILIMTVVLTIGASLASRSINDVSISRQGEAGGQTMQAAESRIEQVLSDLSSYTQGSNSLGDVTIGNVQTSGKVDRLREITTRVDEGGAVTVSLIDPTTGSSVITGANSIYVDWGLNDVCPNIASLLVTVVNSTNGLPTGTISERHYAYGGAASEDPSCQTTNGFLTVGNTTSGGYIRRELPLSVGDMYVNIVVLTNSTALRITKGTGINQLPYQSYAIRSDASNTEGNERSSVQVNRTVPAFPSVFNFVLYSGGTVNK